MKYIILLFGLFGAVQGMAQTVFEENFEALAGGTDLTTQGYVLSQSSSYTGTVTATVVADGSNNIARMVASPNGAADMQIVKAVDVVPGKTYAFELDSRGPFKRQLKIFSQADELLGFSAEYKPATTAEETTWKHLEVVIVPGVGITKVKIGLYHYWSGTIDIDNIKVSETVRQTSYYLSNAGSDDNPGTKDAPWQSLDKISATTLFPGDTVLFRRGDRFDGHFVVNGSGDEGKPVLITSYGTGEKPILTGQVGAAGGGDYLEAVLVNNHDHLVFDGLEIQNERTVSRNGVADTDACGLSVLNDGTSIMCDFEFRNMTFRNVFAVQPMLDPADFNSIQVSGLRFYSNRNNEAGKEKQIRDIEIKDNYFANLQRFGIQFRHSGGATGVGNDSLNRNMNIWIHNNEFYYNGGSAVLPNSTYNCLIENNIFDHPGASTDPRMPGRGSSVWNYKAINTIVQYNMCISTRGYYDSHGIHIDNYNTNTFVQYNYMVDCEGGFVEILKGNVNAVYRFNVSVNDGWRANPTWKDSNHTIWVNADRWGAPEDFNPSDSVYIYNNTVVIDSAYTTSINMDGKNMFVYNNIFSSTNGAGMGVQNMVIRNNDTPFFMSNNLFEGNVEAGFVAMDAHPQKGDPMFIGTGDNQDAYQLQAGSPAIDSGVAVTGPAVEGAGRGVFKNIPAFPTVDIFGNPVDLANGHPNIGACNDKVGALPTGMSAKMPQNGGWLVYPEMQSAMMHVQSPVPLSGNVSVSLINLKGQLVMKENLQLSNPEKTFDVHLSMMPANGIYILQIENAEAHHSRKLLLYR